MRQRIVLKLIRFYQIFISPLLGLNCRFYPTCSCYALISFKKNGFLLGFLKSLKRILKCHPFNKGGIDFP